MLVVNGDRRSIPGSEKQVIAWLRTWSTPGVAISGCIVPGRKGEGGEADLVVITPDTCAVIEVKGIRRRLRGAVLTCPASDEWTVPGEDMTPLMHVRSGDTNPLDQVSDRMFDLKALVPEEFVAGAVLVVPLPGSHVQLSLGTMPTGRTVLLGADATELRRWLDRSTSRSAGTWTADKAAKLLQLLGITSVDEAALVDEGFPPAPAAAAAPKEVAVVDPPAPPPERPLAQVRRLRPFDPTAIVVPEATTTVDIDSYALGRTGGENLSIVMPPEQLPHELLTQRASGGTGTAIAVVATLAVLVGGAWFLAAAGETPQPGVQPETSLTTVPEESPAVPEPPAPRFGEQKPLWSSAPAKTATPTIAFDFSVGGPTCFPFQPDC